MRVAILCNGYDLALWQRRAIDRIAPGHSLYVLAVGEQPPPPRRPRHWAYYALNLFTIRNRQTARVPFPDPAVAIVDRLDAQPEFDGHWAVLTPDMIEWLKDNRIDTIVKFGLGLLRVPDESVLPIPILSYHHGNPENYRGRPAGFHELANGEPFVGQVVQILTNRLDAGRIVASSESRSVAHSYRQTLVGLYSLSPYLLPDALRAVARGDSRAVAPGRNFRLPGTLAVIRFLLQRWRALLERLAYGAFVEKKWKVGWCGMSPSADPLSAVRDAEAQPWQVPRIASPYSFYADPFFEPDGESIVVEAMNGWSGKGEIVRLRPGSAEPLRGLNGHASYPICVEDSGQAYIVPEISDWSPATLLRREADELIRRGPLDTGGARLIDPTPVSHDGRWYLFANMVDEGPSVLHLWSADTLFGRFELHPESPVRISARGSRMAGEIASWGGNLYRLGQDCSGGYGDGIIAFRIDRLSATEYREEMTGTAAFGSVRGPHTVNQRNGRLLFDFYRERFSVLAGIRRAVGKL